MCGTAARSASLLVDQPAMAAVVADLAVESEAATVTAMRLARAYDDDADAAEQAFRRLATAVSKYWVCKRGPGHAYEALECLGGNGYTEASRSPAGTASSRCWRSGRARATSSRSTCCGCSHREPEAFEAFFGVVADAGGEHAALDLEIAEAQAVVLEVVGGCRRGGAARARGSPSGSPSCCRRRCSCSTRRRGRRTRSCARASRATAGRCTARSPSASTLGDPRAA